MVLKVFCICVCVGNINIMRGSLSRYTSRLHLSRGGHQRIQCTGGQQRIQWAQKGLSIDLRGTSRGRSILSGFRETTSLIESPYSDGGSRRLITSLFLDRADKIHFHRPWHDPLFMQESTPEDVEKWLLSLLRSTNAEEKRNKSNS